MFEAATTRCRCFADEFATHSNECLLRAHARRIQFRMSGRQSIRDHRHRRSQSRPTREAETVSTRHRRGTRERQVTRRRKNLSDKQLAILEVIQRSVAQRGYPPSMREIGDAVGLSSLSSVTHQLNQLELSGYLRRDPNRPRALEVLIELPGVEPRPQSRASPRPSATPRWCRSWGASPPACRSPPSSRSTRSSRSPGSSSARANSSSSRSSATP